MSSIALRIWRFLYGLQISPAVEVEQAGVEQAGAEQAGAEQMEQTEWPGQQQSTERAERGHQFEGKGIKLLVKYNAK